MLKSSDIDRASALFTCLTSLSSHDWESAEIVTVRPTTPHFIREAHKLQHAMFILAGSIRIHQISQSGREVTLYRVREENVACL